MNRGHKVQLPDSSYLFSIISPDVATNINLGFNHFNQGMYVFPAGSLITTTILPTLGGLNNLTLSGSSGITPLSTVNFSSSSTSTFSSGNIMTPFGTSIYTLSGKNAYGDPIVLGNATIIGTNSPIFSAFSANVLGNTPNSPLQINYSTQNASNIALTSNMRSISIPSDAFSGSLVVNNPQNGEVFTLTATDSATNQTQQIQLTFESTAIFNCIPPKNTEVHTGARSIFYGSGELTLAVSLDNKRLYVGRALSIPALIYLDVNLIEMNEVSSLPLSTFNFFADGTPEILSCDNNNLYVCQPAGGKVTIFDILTQTAVSQITGTRPTNIEVNDTLIVIKDNKTLKIFDKSYMLLSQFDLEGLVKEANDKEIFITSDRIYVLDGSKVKIINLGDLTTIEKTIDLSTNYHILSGSLVVAETLNKIFIIGSNLTNIPNTTSNITGITVQANLWVYDLATDQLETVNTLQTTDRPDIRYGMRLDIDESRLFIVADYLNTVFCLSTDKTQAYQVLEKWNTTKPFGLGLSPSGQYLYYSGQDTNTYTLNTQSSRHLVIMRLREPTLTIDIT